MFATSGRIAFTRRLKGSANLVKWLKPSGAAYMLVIRDKVEVCGVPSCTFLISVSCPYLGEQEAE